MALSAVSGISFGHRGDARPSRREAGILNGRFRILTGDLESKAGGLDFGGRSRIKDRRSSFEREV